MFRLAVFNLRDILRYLLCLVVAVTTIYLANRYFFSRKNDSKKVDFFDFVEKQAVGLISVELPQIERIKALHNENSENGNVLFEEDDDDLEDKFLMGLINTQIGIVVKDFKNAKSNADKENDVISDEVDGETTDIETNKTEEIDINNEEPKKMDNIIADINTEVVTKNPLADAYTDMFENVKIKNETNFTLSNDILNPEGLNINGKNILIFHTHTCESYTSSDEYTYTPTGSYRTTDLNYSVARVGDELEGYLKSYGFNVKHDKTYHDYPAYTGSYSRSLATVQNLLNEEKYDIIIDLHRDAIGSRPDYAPTVKIGDEYAAQLMFVLGSNGGGLYHPNWSSNLKFAVKVQEVANTTYPGIFKPIIFRNSRYNQHLGKAACIIEVGSTGNTLEETLVSMKYLASVLDSVLIH